MLAVRLYGEKDHDAVWELHNLALVDTEAHAGNGPWDDDLHHIEDVYLGNGGTFLVGEIDDRIVAMGAVRRTTSERAEIKRMRVHPDFQRKGYGRTILGQLEQFAWKKGYQALHLDTTVKQVGAQRLYEKFGYKQTGREEWKKFTLLFYEKSRSDNL